ncbi:hypothetical protein HYY75_08340, partial [bacterium]|nr:hypothetical protein [bacterium]
MIFDLRTRTKRAGFLFTGIFFVLFLYVVRLFQLTVFQYDDWLDRSERNHQSKRVIEKKRGKILDRKKAELALSVEVYSLYLYTREVKSISNTVNMLSSVIPMTREEILLKINNRKGYLMLAKDLDRHAASRILSLGLPGIVLEEGFKRINPQNSLGSNLIGFCGKDGRGLEGLELLFDRTLRGYPGFAVQEDVSLGEAGPPRLRVLQPPTGGSDLSLTIDSFIQHILETELAKLVEQYKPIDATAIVIDPYTGEILGMACLPNYDLNTFFSSPAET